MRSVSGAVRSASLAIGVLLLAYLAVLALEPSLRERLPAGLQWFGASGSAATIAIVTAVLLLAGALVYHAHRVRQGAAPVAIVAGLALISLSLGLASFWHCYDETHPRFFTALMWTAGVVKGGGGGHSLEAGAARPPRPWHWRSRASRLWRRCSSASSASRWHCSGPNSIGCGSTLPFGIRRSGPR